MNVELILALVAIVATPITGWLTSKLTKSKYNAEIGRLHAEVEAAKADASNKELKNAQLGNEIIMQNIVRPLEVQIKRLNTNVSRFEKAVAKIPACPHSTDCPVTGELLASQESYEDKLTDEPADRRVHRARQRGQNRQHRDREHDRFPEFEPEDFD